MTSVRRQSINIGAGGFLQTEPCLSEHADQEDRQNLKVLLTQAGNQCGLRREVTDLRYAEKKGLW